MTEALTGANRSNRIDLVAEQRMRQAKATDEAKKDLEVAGPLAARPAQDEVKLSNVTTKAASGPDFDQAKVDRIRKAIEEGNYPLDSRRIAESFLALEKLI
ncbi:MAG: flagellar biosynthesis anti-sigma factor FlgM [Burkholderiaceae bacterium]|jgi:negative regulator of flagellin synthesis FlgM|nr:flagellar biosynthesis anti-sigma factor FlgM [Burkholderiaceae bacterium]